MVLYTHISVRNASANKQLTIHIAEHCTVFMSLQDKRHAIQLLTVTLKNI